MCIECLKMIGSDLYVNCVRCSRVLHPSCGIRGQDAVGPTVELFCSECSDAIEMFREAQEAEGAILVQRRTARAIQAAGAVVDGAFATGAAAGAAAATMVRAAGALVRGAAAGVERTAPEESAATEEGEERFQTPQRPAGEDPWLVRDPWSGARRRRTGRRDQPAYVKISGSSNPYLIANASVLPTLPGVSSRKGTSPEQYNIQVNDEMLTEGETKEG